MTKAVEEAPRKPLLVVIVFALLAAFAEPILTMCWRKVTYLLSSLAITTALSNRNECTDEALSPARIKQNEHLYRQTFPSTIPKELMASESTGSSFRSSRRSFLVRASTATLLLATSSAVVSTPSAVYAASSSAPSIPLPRQQNKGLNIPFPKFQFDTVGDVPKSYFTEQRSVYAFVERVIDGDTIRVRHVPFYGFTKRAPSPLTSRGIADQTMSIRIYGVDCPEIGKNGQAGQPFADKAKQFTIELLLHKMVKITFLRRDQYGRAVSAVETVSPWWSMGLGRKDLSMELAKAGLAELYTGGGAEYYDKRARLEKRILQAQDKKVGIWSQGKKRTSAADFKKNQNSAPVPVATGKNKKTDNRNILQSSSAQNKRATPAVAAANREKKRTGKLFETAITGLEFTT